MKRIIITDDKSRRIIDILYIHQIDIAWPAAYIAILSLKSPGYMPGDKDNPQGVQYTIEWYRENGYNVG